MPKKLLLYLMICFFYPLHPMDIAWPYPDTLTDPNEPNTIIDLLSANRLEEALNLIQANIQEAHFHQDHEELITYTRISELVHNYQEYGQLSQEEIIELAGLLGADNIINIDEIMLNISYLQDRAA